jgi:hypothetical protein
MPLKFSDVMDRRQSRLIANRFSQTCYRFHLSTGITRQKFKRQLRPGQITYQIYISERTVSDRCSYGKIGDALTVGEPELVLFRQLAPIPFRSHFKIIGFSLRICVFHIREKRPVFLKLGQLATTSGANKQMGILDKPSEFAHALFNDDCIITPPEMHHLKSLPASPGRDFGEHQSAIGG